MSSPPKPWEKVKQSAKALQPSQDVATTITVSSGLNPPAIPERPSNLNYVATGSYGSMSGYRSGYNGGYGNNIGTGHSTYGTRYGGGYGTGGYNYGYSGYGSPSSYNGYGSRYGGGYGGIGMGPNGLENGPSLLNTVESAVQPAFQTIDNIVNVFGGFAHMLESTLMAIHSSFMAMVGVIDQLSRLRMHLSPILGAFSLVRATRNFLYRIIGKKPPVNLGELNISDFNRFQQKKSSKRPVILFLLVVLGIPFLMHRLIILLAKRQQTNGTLPAEKSHSQLGSLPEDVEFSRATYDFNGDNIVELSFKRGDVIAILSKVDLHGQPSDWWRGRLRNGQVGIIPSNYVEILEKKPKSNGPQVTS